VPWHIPFPGGATIGLLMLLNLLPTHTSRFKMTRRRFGVIVLHAAEFATVTSYRLNS
jgi:hypothetical protein